VVHEADGGGAAEAGDEGSAIDFLKVSSRFGPPPRATFDSRYDGILQKIVL
jgi:hypothetical protein